MNESVKVLHLITARGGSKGVPNKNVECLNGVPLVGWRAIAAQKSSCCDKLIISTDSQEIAAVAKEYDVEVPFMRPSELANDEASSVDVIKHALEFLDAEGLNYDVVVLHEPSAPFCRSSDIDQAVNLLLERKADLVVSVYRHKIHPIHIGAIGSDGNFSEVIENVAILTSTNRQALAKQYTMNGCVYAFTSDFFRSRGTIYAKNSNSLAFEMPSEYSVEIDEPCDLEWARYLLKSGKIDLTNWSF